MLNPEIMNELENNRISKKLREQKCFTKNTKLQMILSLNLSLELPDRSYSISDTQDCFEYIIKKYETLTYKPPVQKYVS